MVNASETINNLAKILVGRQKHRSIRVGFIHDAIVIDSRRKFRDGDDVDSILPQSQHDSSSDALMGDDLHALCFAIG